MEQMSGPRRNSEEHDRNKESPGSSSGARARLEPKTRSKSDQAAREAIK